MIIAYALTGMIALALPVVALRYRRWWLVLATPAVAARIKRQLP